MGAISHQQGHISFKLGCGARNALLPDASSSNAEER